MVIKNNTVFDDQLPALDTYFYFKMLEFKSWDYLDKCFFFYTTDINKYIL